jgi:hypothetical protein
MPAVGLRLLEGSNRVKSTVSDPPEFIYFLPLFLLQFAPGIIRCPRQLHGEVDESIALTIEKPVGGPGIDGGHRTSQRRGGRPNHRTGRQGFACKKIARLGQDLVGLGELQC